MKRWLTIIMLYLASSAAHAENTDVLFNLYQKSKQQEYTQAANKVFKSLYKEGYSDTLRIFSPSQSKNAVNAYIFEAMGQWYLDKSNYHESIRITTEAASLCSMLKDSLYTSNCYATLSIAYMRIGDMHHAIQYAKLCYIYDLASGDKGNISSSLGNIAGMYLSDGQPKAAEKYILRAIDIEESIHRDKFLAIRYGTASEIYTALKNYKKAIGYAQKAYGIDLKGQRTDKAGIRLAQLAAAYDAGGYKKEAEKCYLKSIGMLEKNDVKVSLSIVYNQLGTLLASKGEKKRAISYLKKSVAVSNEIDNKMQALKAYTELGNLLEKVSPQEAITCWKSVDKLRKSIYLEESENQMNRFNIEYETKEKEEQIAWQQVKISKDRTKRLHLIIGLIVCLVVIILTTLAIRQEHKRNKYLSELNNLKDRFDSLMAHDLKNPILAQKKTLDIIVDHFESLTHEELKSLCANLKESSTSLLELIHNLLSWSQMEEGRIPYHPCLFPIIDVVREVSSLYAINLQKKEIKLSTDIPTDALAFADRSMTDTVLRNIVNNAIKFSNPNGNIQITAANLSTVWKITVTDEGIGMDKESLNNLFRIDIRHSSQGTQGEKGTGLGLPICKEMIEKNGGILNVESEVGKGSRFSFTLKSGNDQDNSNQKKL